jgi:hypothetical protein
MFSFRDIEVNVKTVNSGLVTHTEGKMLRPPMACEHYRHIRAFLLSFHSNKTGTTYQLTIKATRSLCGTMGMDPWLYRQVRKGSSHS